MGYERVELHLATEPVVRLRRWRTGKPGGAYVFVDERAACDLADRWLARGEWKPVPACYDARGMPADGGDWWLRGQEWLPGPKPT